MTKKAEVIMVLDKNDKDGGEKRGSARYVAAAGQDFPAMTNAYIMRSFIGPAPSPEKVRITLETIE